MNNATPPSPESIDELLVQVGEHTVTVPAIEVELDAESRVAEIKATGLEQFYVLRMRWSGYIIWLVWFMVLSQVALVVAVGGHLIDLTNYKSFLNAIVGENFLQILGLGYIVVNFLYDKNRD